MSELGKASPEAVEQFNRAVLHDPALIGNLLSWGIEHGYIQMPEDSSEGVDAEELIRRLQAEEVEETQQPSVEFDLSAARKAQKRAMLESQRKALLHPKIDVIKER